MRRFQQSKRTHDLSSFWKCGNWPARQRLSGSTQKIIIDKWLKIIIVNEIKTRLGSSQRSVDQMGFCQGSKIDLRVSTWLIQHNIHIVWWNLCARSSRKKNDSKIGGFVRILSSTAMRPLKPFIDSSLTIWRRSKLFVFIFFFFHMMNNPIDISSRLFSALGKMFKKWKMTVEKVS